MDKTCSLESPNVLVCNVEEKSRGWFMIHRIIFSQEGLVVEINFESENVSTKKYYSKISEEEMVEKEEEDSDG